MAQNRAESQYQVEGGMVYSSTDSVHDPHPLKTKSVRKVVRLIIEKDGRDGTTVKKDIATKYYKGRVLWMGKRVAEWDEEKNEMRLVDELAGNEDEFKRMMGQE